MQYTAGSFAGIITEWFAWILRPRAPRASAAGVVPGGAPVAEHTPETVLERVVEPAGRAGPARCPPRCAGCSTAGCRPTSSTSWWAWPRWRCWSLIRGGTPMTAVLETSRCGSRSWLLLAPLLPGIINKVKAWVAGRRGPPVLQLYYDLARLWRKGRGAEHARLAGARRRTRRWPGWRWSARRCCCRWAGGGQRLAFRGDALLFVYLLALARFCTALAALDTGSAFEGMGAAREVSYAVLAEAAIITALLTLSVQTGSVSLATMLAPSAGAGAAAAWRRACSPCCWRRTAACRSTTPTRTSS